MRVFDSAIMHACTRLDRALKKFLAVKNRSVLFCSFSSSWPGLFVHECGRVAQQEDFGRANNLPRHNNF